MSRFGEALVVFNALAVIGGAFGMLIWGVFKIPDSGRNPHQSRGG